MKAKATRRTGRVIPFERDVEFFLRRGSQRLERNDLIEAISNYHLAHFRDPRNLETQLAIAEVLTEMHRYEQSNRILFPLLSVKNSPSECFFGIACNFLGLQEFQHAHDSLEKYLSLDPDGEFVPDSLDMLDVIEDENMLYSMPGVYAKEEREAFNICMRGRQMLENGQIPEAVALLKGAINQYPDMHFVRNNLALAYFCAKEFQLAMEEVRHVLEDDPDDVQAHCNLLLFLHAANNEEGVEQALRFLRNCETLDPKDWNRMAVVYMELGLMEEALSMLKKLQIVFPYDENTLHRLGACYYRLGNYKQAVACYDRLAKVDPYDTIAGYYRKVALRALKGEPEDIDWLYSYQVPYVELLRRVREINEISGQSREEIQLRWKNSREFRALLLWSLKLPDPDTKRTMLLLITSFRDHYAEMTLRQFQIDQSQPEEVKQEVFAMLKSMDAREPYVAYLNGNLMQSRMQVHRASRNGARLPVAYQRALELCVKHMQEHPGNEGVLKAVEIFQHYVAAQKELPKLRRPQVYAFAAALDYIASERVGMRNTKAQTAERYGISTLRLNNAVGRLLRVIEQGES